VSILSTRPDGAADPLVSALTAAGHRVLAVPTVALLPVEPPGALDRAVAELSSFDWVVLTSAAGANAVVEAARRRGPSEMDLEPPRWAAVGHATAAVLEAAGVRVSLIPEISRGAAITGALLSAGPLAGSRILLPRSDLADGALPQALRAAGATVVEVIAYRTVEGPAASEPALREALAAPDLRTIILCSGSAVRGLITLSAGTDGAQATGVHPVVTATPLVSIGPSTSAAIREAGLQVAVEASRQSVEGLVAAVEELLAEPHPSSGRTPQEVAS